MSTRFWHSPPTLRVELRPSRYLCAALLTAALLATLAVWRTDISWPLRLAAALAVAVYTGLALRRCAGWTGVLNWDGAGWLWCRRDGQRVLTLQRATVWRGLMVLHFRCADGRRQVLTLLPDSAGCDQLRRLRVSLLHLPVFGA